MEVLKECQMEPIMKIFENYVEKELKFFCSFTRNADKFYLEFET